MVKIFRPDLRMHTILIIVMIILIVALNFTFTFRPAIFGYAPKVTEQDDFVESTVASHVEINKPVRWVAYIPKPVEEEAMFSLTDLIESPEPVDPIVLPDYASNITIMYNDSELGSEYYSVIIDENGTRVIFSTNISQEIAENFEILYETPAPQVEEIELTPAKKQITVYSDISYENVITYTTIPNSPQSSIKLFWYINDIKTDVTNDPDIGLTYEDTDVDGMIDYLEWITPHLSNQTFEIEISIEVLNVYSYLRSGDTWQVAFVTNGTADLVIDSPNASWTEMLTDDFITEDEMEFIDLRCGNDSLQGSLQLIDSLGNTTNYSQLTSDDFFKPTKFLIENYSCSETAYFENLMHIAGYAALKFQFGNETAWAYDPYPGPPDCADNTDCATCIAGGCEWCNSTNPEFGNKCYQPLGENEPTCTAMCPEPEINCGTQCGAYKCGDTISGDVTLEFDILGCNKPIFQITSSNTTLDCDGHTLETGQDYGVNVTNVKNISIANCVINVTSAHNYGIYFFRVNNSIIENNTIFIDNGTGVFIDGTQSTPGSAAYNGSNFVSIRNNTLNVSDNVGVLVRHSANTTISNNTIYANGWGIDISGSSDSLVYNNTISVDNYSAILLHSPSIARAYCNIIDQNNMTALDTGIFFATADGWLKSNVLSNNDITVNNTGIFVESESQIFVLSHNNNISSNTIYANHTGVEFIASEDLSENNAFFNNTITVQNHTALFIAGPLDYIFYDNIFNVTDGNLSAALTLLGDVYIYNSTFSATESPQIYINATSPNDLHIINSTFNISDMAFSSNDSVGTNIFVKWYVDVYVEDDDSSPFSGAIVNISQANGTEVVNTSTNSSGYTVKYELIEFRENQTERNYTDYLNYQIDARNDKCNWSTTKLNLTETNSTTVNMVVDDSCSCTAGINCYSILCIAGTCGSSCAADAGYGCSDNGTVWNAADGGTCISADACDYNDPVRGDCGVACDLGSDLFYDVCTVDSGDSCDNATGGGNFAQTGLCADSSGAICLTSGFVVFDSGQYEASDDLDSADEGDTCDETLTDADFSAGTKRYDDDDGGHCDDCDNGYLGEDSQCEEACGAASACDERAIGYDWTESNTCKWCVNENQLYCPEEDCTVGSDTTFYSVIRDANVECDDVDCDTGSCSDGYCLDDDRDTCYYNFVCDGGLACDYDPGSGTIRPGWQNDEEKCYDYCIGNGQYGGGTCTQAQKEPEAAQTTCYYTDTCTSTTCELTSSGTLRQYWCDVCAAGGVTTGEYCPLPGTTGTVDNHPEKCYYDGPGDHSCAGTPCNLDVDTTIYGAVTWSACDYKSQTGDNDYCLDSDVNWCYNQSGDSCNTSSGWGGSDTVDFTRIQCNQSGLVSEGGAGSSDNRCYYDPVNEDSNRNNDCSATGCAVTYGEYGIDCDDYTLGTGFSHCLDATDGVDDCYYSSDGCNADGDAWDLDNTDDCYGTIDGDVDIEGGLCFYTDETCAYTGCTNGTSDDGPGSISWGDCDIDGVESGAAYDAGFHNSWCYDDSADTCYYDSSAINDDCTNSDSGWNLLSESCLDPGTVSGGSCYYDNGASLDESDSCDDDNGCSGISSQATPIGCDDGSWSDGAGYCWNQTTCYYDATDLCAMDIDGWDYSSDTTQCTATNAICCTDSTTIWEGVGCSASGVSGTSYDRDTSQARCESTATGCSAYTWLAAGTGANSDCCGDDSTSDGFEQASGAGRSACIDGSEVADGATNDSFIVSNGQIYSCGAAANAFYAFDDDHTATTCVAVEGKYCNNDNTWKTTKPPLCECTAGNACTDGTCVDACTDGSCGTGICESDGCQNNVTIPTRCSGNSFDYDSADGGICVFDGDVYYCDDDEVANKSAVPQLVDDCAQATYVDQCDDAVSGITGYVPVGLCGGTSFQNCLTAWGSDQTNDANSPDFGVTGSTEADVCGGKNTWYCDNMADLSWDAGDTAGTNKYRCDDSDDKCILCNADGQETNHPDSSGSDELCELACGADSDCDERDANTIQDSGNTAGCGDDSTASKCDTSCAYSTLDCDASDTCSNICDGDDQVRSYKDYYVHSDFTCTFVWGSIVEDCLAKSSVCTAACPGCSYRDYDGCSGSACTYTDYDPDASQTYCNLCPGSGNWSIGGETAATTCCGDDASENDLSRIANDTMDGGYATDNSDNACCIADTDCVNNSVCYDTADVSTNVDGDNDTDYCNVGTWYDCNTDAQCNASYACSANDCVLAAMNITYAIPTPIHDSRQINNSVIINVSVNSSVASINNCTLVWNDVNETMTMIGSGTQVSCNITKATTDGQNYSFRVFAYNTVGAENSTSERNFTENTKPSTSTHFAPANDTRLAGNSQIIYWTDGADAESDTITYHWRIDTDDPPATPFTCSGSTTDNESTSCSTTDGTEYYWNIIADDGYENQTVTTPWKFSENNEPSVSGVVLNATSSDNRTADNLTVWFSTSDDDSDQVYNITDWRLNDASIAALNMPFDTNRTGQSGVVVREYSTFENNGTFNDMPVWTSSGQVGGAYTFDGINDRIMVADDDSLANTDMTGLTVSAWVYINSISWTDRSAVVSKYNSTGNQRSYEFSLGKNGNTNDNSTPCFVTSSAPTAVSVRTACGTTKLASGQWYHIVAAWRKDNMLIYVNSNLEKNDTSSSVPDNLANNNLPLYIGYSAEENQHFNGTIDDVRIYNRTLSTEQVEAEYEAGLAGRAPTILVSNEITRDDVWSVAVTPNDLYEDGSTVVSASLTITNTPPEAPTTFTPSSGTWGGYNDTVDLNCSGSTDADNDDVNYTIEYNNSGSWIEIATDLDLGNYSWDISSELSYANVYFRCKSFDHADSSDYTVFSTNVNIDNQAPQWSDARTNGTTIYRGEDLQMFLNWTDSETFDIGLDGYIFSTNDSGSWVNSTYFVFDLSNNVSNYTMNITGTDTDVVGWRYYANDSYDNMNGSDIFTFDVTPKALAIQLVGFDEGIKWSTIVPNVVEEPADGNNDAGATDYIINVSDADGTSVDIYVVGNSSLTSGADTIDLSNEKIANNTVDDTVPSDDNRSITTSYSDNKIGINMQEESTVYVKFFITVPAYQSAGEYVNNVTFKGIQYGGDPDA